MAWRDGRSRMRTMRRVHDATSIASRSAGRSIVVIGARRCPAVPTTGSRIRRSDQGAVGAGAEPAAAAQRSDPEPRRNGEGLCRAGEGDLHGDRGRSREKLAGARTPEDTIKAANEQSSALARLLVVVENYPQLKSDANFQRLMDELAGTENRIADRADALQRARPGVQHAAPPVPVERDRQGVRLQGVSRTSRRRPQRSRSRR